MNFLLRSLYEVLQQLGGLGTFLEFRVSMSGAPTAVYTHGKVEFTSFDDLTEWWRPRHEALQRGEKISV